MPKRPRSQREINAYRRSYAGEDYLYTVVTLTEAARRWKRHPMTIRRHIDSGRLCARKSDHIWLISVDSLIELWGGPKVGSLV